ncbi:hypothetical protein BgiBS90_023424, partial [Biomphalaria glabrata]
KLSKKSRKKAGPSPGLWSNYDESFDDQYTVPKTKNVLDVDQTSTGSTTPRKRGGRLSKQSSEHSSIDMKGLSRPGDGKKHKTKHAGDKSSVTLFSLRRMEESEMDYGQKGLDQLTRSYLDRNKIKVTKDINAFEASSWAKMRWDDEVNEETIIQNRMDFTPAMVSRRGETPAEPMKSAAEDEQDHEDSRLDRNVEERLIRAASKLSSGTDLLAEKRSKMTKRVSSITIKATLSGDAHKTSQSEYRLKKDDKKKDKDDQGQTDDGPMNLLKAFMIRRESVVNKSKEFESTQSRKDSLIVKTGKRYSKETDDLYNEDGTSIPSVSNIPDSIKEVISSSYQQVDEASMRRDTKTQMLLEKRKIAMEAVKQDKRMEKKKKKELKTAAAILASKAKKSEEAKKYGGTVHSSDESLQRKVDDTVSSEISLKEMTRVTSSLTKQPEKDDEDDDEEFEYDMAMFLRKMSEQTKDSKIRIFPEPMQKEAEKPKDFKSGRIRQSIGAIEAALIQAQVIGKIDRAGAEQAEDDEEEEPEPETFKIVDFRGLMRHPEVLQSIDKKESRRRAEKMQPMRTFKEKPKDKRLTSIVTKEAVIPAKVIGKIDKVDDERCEEEKDQEAESEPELFHIVGSKELIRQPDVDKIQIEQKRVSSISSAEELTRAKVTVEVGIEQPEEEEENEDEDQEVEEGPKRDTKRIQPRKTAQDKSKEKGMPFISQAGATFKESHFISIDPAETKTKEKTFKPMDSLGMRQTEDSLEAIDKSERASREDRFQTLKRKESLLAGPVHDSRDAQQVVKKSESHFSATSLDTRSIHGLVHLSDSQVSPSREQTFETLDQVTALPRTDKFEPLHSAESSERVKLRTIDSKESVDRIGELHSVDSKEAFVRADALHRISSKGAVDISGYQPIDMKKTDKDSAGVQAIVAKETQIFANNVPILDSREAKLQSELARKMQAKSRDNVSTYQSGVFERTRARREEDKDSASAGFEQQPSSIENKIHAARSKTFSQTLLTTEAADSHDITFTSDYIDTYFGTRYSGSISDDVKASTRALGLFGHRGPYSSHELAELQYYMAASEALFLRERITTESRPLTVQPYTKMFLSKMTLSTPETICEELTLPLSHSLLDDKEYSIAVDDQRIQQTRHHHEVESRYHRVTELMNDEFDLDIRRPSLNAEWFQKLNLDIARMNVLSRLLRDPRRLHQMKNPVLPPLKQRRRNLAISEFTGWDIDRPITLHLMNRLPNDGDNAKALLKMMTKETEKEEEFAKVQKRLSFATSPKEDGKAYANRQGLDELFEFLLYSLLKFQPDNALDYLIDITRQIKRQMKIRYDAARVMMLAKTNSFSKESHHGSSSSSSSSYSSSSSSSSYEEDDVVVVLVVILIAQGSFSLSSASGPIPSCVLYRVECLLQFLSGKGTSSNTTAVCIDSSTFLNRMLAAN